MRSFGSGASAKIARSASGRSVAFMAVAVLTMLAGAQFSIAQTVISKSNANTNLNAASAWVGGVVPGTSNIMQFDSNDQSVLSVTTTNALSVAGLSITNPAGAITISAASDPYFYTNASGINMSSATQNLTISEFYCVNVSQSASIASGQLLDLAGTFLYLFNNTWTVNTIGSAVCSVSGQIEYNAAPQLYGTGEIIKQGSGVMVLYGSNGNTGGDIVQGGVLELANSYALPGGIGTTGGTCNLNIAGGVVGPV